jgi:hypothetical protein
MKACAVSTEQAAAQLDAWGAVVQAWCNSLSDKERAVFMRRMR